MPERSRARGETAGTSIRKPPDTRADLPITPRTMLPFDVPRPLSFFRRFSLSPRLLVTLFVTLSLLVVGSALIEMSQSKRELMDLMEEQAHSLLESILVASDNSLNATDQVRELAQQRLLDNAGFVRSFYDAGQVDDSMLARLSRSHGSLVIQIVRPDGRSIYSSHPRDSITPEASEGVQEALGPIFSGHADTLMIGVAESGSGSGDAYTLAIAARDRSAVLLQMDAGQIRAFEREIGFGSFLRRMGDHPELVYVALQDTRVILAAGGQTELLEPIEDTAFLEEVLADTSLLARQRIVPYGDTDVLEVVLPFFYREVPVGLFRLGVSLAPLQDINARIVRRLFLITLVILATGFVVLTLIVARQNADLLERQYKAVETYSRRVIENVSDGIIVFDASGRIRTVNQAAQELFDLPADDALGRPIREVMGEKDFLSFLDSPALQASITYRRSSEVLHLLGVKSFFADEKGEVNSLLVFRDLSRQHQLEAQNQERARLSALGEMAGGFAHEIRNPLNAVGTLVQQLRTDFSPVEGAGEYDELMGIVYQEVRRINESVQTFLRMVRPEPVRRELFVLGSLIRYLRQEYLPTVQDRGITLEVRTEWDGEVLWDRQQMQQVFENLLQNAVEATPEGGRITVTVARPGIDRVEIRVKDTGPGIPEAIRHRVFDLYYTTKPGGTGIGLSLVQRIVNDHGGTVELESSDTAGTTFILHLPRQGGAGTTEHRENGSPESIES